ncbi:unnamed protein product [Chilo suppressalis]|uniref:PHD-type domain-containing protein n=1 Tax=Chilo suppressalis TaxID=168631 RepID=A0ABN8BCA9_CHISP|nr:unnamed protein product [Chilo suppressalis]
MALKCAGCLQNITNRQYLTCSQCKDKYDLQCANVSIQRFFNTMSAEHKAVWRCDRCRLKEPKKDNSNTPIRPHHDILTSPETNTSPVNNITLRNRTTKIRLNDDTQSSLEDLSVLDNTINTENSTSKPNKDILKEPSIQTITLHQFETLLDQKLDTYKQSLLSDLMENINSLISKNIASLKHELSQTTNNLISEQITLKENIACLNHKILELENGSCKLREEMKEIQNSLNSINTQEHERSLSSKDQNANKKIVIYGLDENAWETEIELLDRVTYIFHDVLNINVSGYLENVRRIGNRNGRRRPLLVEFMKRQPPPAAVQVSEQKLQLQPDSEVVGIENRVEQNSLLGPVVPYKYSYRMSRLLKILCKVQSLSLHGVRKC